jgi:eukaryotic-like serine/threonine-protein kinase
VTESKITKSNLTASSEVRLVEVLDAYMAAAAEGRAPTKTELLEKHPDLAGDLEACLASLEFIERASVASPFPPVDSNTSEGSSDEPGIGTLGDFRLIAEVGRGGMGVVYEAVQLSLNRRVALKVLPFASAMDPTQLRRFHTESLAAAQLHHMHIVPVYSVGCERGVHYYAMQFIEGQTLAQVIAERRRPPTLMGERCPKGRIGSDRDGSRFLSNNGSSSPGPSRGSREFFRTAASLGIQAAEALDHAHKLGIVHRDIKPANLLVDVQGRLWVMDFGLARLQGAMGLTMTGDVLGTLRYMSPEQALAKRAVVDHRADVYSLGATLYELVALEPAVDGRDRQEVLRKIAQEEPTPPRRHDPAIPRELETILLKAMNREPASRYDTAHGFADDLARFLKHEPIRARRPTALERAAKWSRRHPTVVASAVSGLLLVVVGLTATLLAVNRERARTDAKSKEVGRLAHKLEWELYVSRVNQAHGDWHDGNLVRAEAALESCPAELRNWEWRYVRKLCRQEIYSVLAHELPEGMDCVSVRFTPDGTRWLSAAGAVNDAARAGSLSCWDTRRGVRLWDCRGERLTGIRSIAVSPTGGLFAVAPVDDQAAIQLRDISSGRPIGSLPGGRRWEGTRSLAFSPDGKMLAQLRDPANLVMWDVASRQPLFDVRVHAGTYGALAFDPKGRIVATGGTDGIIRLWNANDGNLVGVMEGHEFIVMDLSFSPDGARLASGGWDQTVRMWDVRKREPFMIMAGHAGFVDHVVYSPDGSRLAASSGQAITVYHAGTGREQFTIRGDSCSGVEFAPDGSLLAVASPRGRASLYAASAAEPQVLRGDGWINCLSFAPDGKNLVAAQANATLIVWDIDSGQRRLELKGHDDAVRTAAYTPDGQRIVSACWDGSLAIWDASTGREIQTLAARDRPRKNRYVPGGIAINWAAVSQDGRLIATAGWDRNVRLWDLATGSPIRAYVNHGATVWGVAFSPAGRLIASAGEDGRIRIWETVTGHDLWSVATDMPALGSVTRQILSFSPNGRLLAGCVELGTTASAPVKIWEAATGVEIQVLRDAGGPINSLAFSPDGSRLVTASENRTVQLWDVETGTNLLVLRGHVASALCVAFSPDGTKLASGSIDNTVRIWSAPAAPMAGSPSPVMSARERRLVPRTTR